MRRFKDAGRTGEVVRISNEELKEITNTGYNIKKMGCYLGKGRNPVNRIYRVIESPRKVYYVSIRE